MFRYLVALVLLLVAGLALGASAEPVIDTGALEQLSGADALTPEATPTRFLQGPVLENSFAAHTDGRLTSQPEADGTPQPVVIAAFPPYSYFVFLPQVNKSPPTPTPTATATSTPAGTATPLPGTQVTMSDDFGDPTSGWPVADYGSYALSYLSGEYRILARSAGWTASAASNVVSNLSGFQASVDARLAGGPSSVYLGIAFGIISPQWVPFYACLVGNGSGGFYVVPTSSWSPAPSMTPYPTDANWSDSGSRRIELVRSGDGVNCYVNGSLAASVTGLPSEWGEVGLILRNPSSLPNADARFDNYFASGTYVVFTPTPTTTPSPTPTATFTPIAAQAQMAVGYRINVAHNGVMIGSTLNPPLKRIWSVDFGQPLSYPLIAEGKVFVWIPMVQQLYALDASSGQVIWGPIEVPNSYGTARPAYDDGNIFITDSNGVLYKFAANSGSLRWARQTGDTWGQFPPSASQGLVYVQGMYGIEAFDSSTGGIHWSSGDQANHSAPTLSQDSLFLQTYCGYTTAHDRWGGAPRWIYDPGCSSSAGPTPIYDGGRVFIRPAYNTLGRILDAQTGTVLGGFRATDVPPAVRSNAMYSVEGGVLTASSIATGTTVWTFSGDGHLATAPIVVNQHVYVASSNGNLYAVDSTNGQQAWSTNVGGTIFTEADLFGPRSGLNAGEGLLVVPATNILVAYAPE